MILNSILHAVLVAFVPSSSMSEMKGTYVNRRQQGFLRFFGPRGFWAAWPIASGG